MPKFPGVLLNNNPNAPSLDLNDLQVKGVGIFADAAERDALDTNIQTEGYLSIMKDDDNVYVYKGGGWTTPANWEKISGTIGFTDDDGNPLGEVSTLVFPEGSISIVGSLGVIAFTAGGTSTDTTNFNGVLSSADTTVQAALDTLDGLSLTLEGLGDTPTGYGTAGQVLITNGVDGFTFGSGSPWDEVAGTTTDILYEEGRVGIRDLTSWNAAGGSISSNNNLGAGFPGASTQAHIHGKLGVSVTRTDNSTYDEALRIVSDRHSSSTGIGIGTYAYGAQIRLYSSFSFTTETGNLRLNVGNLDGMTTELGGVTVGRGGIELPGNHYSGAQNYKLRMAGVIQFKNHGSVEWDAIHQGSGTYSNAGVVIGTPRSGDVLYVRNSDVNTVGSFGYVGVNANSPSATGPAFEVSSSYAKFNNGLHIGDITTTGYAFPTATGTTGQLLQVDANGDLGFVTFQGSPWVSDTNGINYTAGNVGIGAASSSSHALTVQGDAQIFTGNSIASSVRIGSGFGGSNTSQSVYMGYNVGSGTGQANANVVIGTNAAGGTGAYYESVIIGHGALAANTAGTRTSVLIGYSAGGNGGNGYSAVGVGFRALMSAVGAFNTGIGQKAGQMAGGNSTFVGSNAGGSSAAATGVNNVGVGVSALEYVEGDDNTAVGKSSAANLTTGGGNVFLGYQAGNGVITGGTSVAIGYAAGMAHDSSQTVVIGSNAGGNGSSTGSEQVIIGNNAGTGNISGASVVIGSNSGTQSMGYGCVVIGRQAHNMASGGSSGQNNILIGKRVLHNQSYALGSGNIIIGESGGLFGGSNNNIYIRGNGSAGYINIGGVVTTSGISLGGTSDGSHSISMGQSSKATANGISMGFSSGREQTTGSGNTYIGRETGRYTTTGAGNVAIGYQAGTFNSTGSNSVFLGYQAGYNETSSNKLYISNSSTTTPLIYGDFSTSTLRANGTFEIGDPASTGYAFPTATGTTGQLLQVDANGDLGFVTFQGSPWVSDTNGITYTAGNVGIGAASSSDFKIVVRGRADIADSNNNTIVGLGAAPNVTTASNSVIIGHDAVRGASWNFGNSVVIGYQAGQNVSGATGQGGGIFIGSNSGNWSQAYYGSNVNIGAGAGNAGVAIGESAGATGGGGLYGVIIGRQASGGGTVIGANATGGGKVTIGQNASTGSNSIAIGGTANYQFSQSIGGTVNGNYGVAIGSNSAEANSVSIGYTLLSGSSNTIQIGTFNAAYHGNQASTGTPTDNILLGNSVLSHNASANANAITNYTSNVLLGSAIGQYPSGSFASNVIIGQSAYSGGLSSYSTQTGSNNVIIGKGAGAGLGANVGGSNLRPLSGNVLIGYNVAQDQAISNKLYIANSNTTTPLIYGDFSTSTLRANGTFEIGDPASTGYAFPTATGTTGQILQVDANGDLGFVDLQASPWVSDTNGINYTAGNVGIGAASSSSHALRVQGDAQIFTGNNIASSVRIGSGFGGSNTSQSVYMGYNVGSGTGQANANVVIGTNAAGGTGAYYESVIIGHGALAANTAGTRTSVLIGYSAGGDGGNGYSAVGVGFRALMSAVGAFNTGIGQKAGLMAGGNGTFVGSDAGGSSAAATGVNNVGVGVSALEYVEGDNNTAVGKSSAENLTTGGGNVFLGKGSGVGFTTESNNTVVGFGSGGNGVGNVVLGGLNGVKGNTNVIVGYQTDLNVSGATVSGFHTIVGGLIRLGSNSTFTDTTIVGKSAGEYGSVIRSVIMGHEAAKNNSSQDSVLIGYQVKGGATNSVFVGHKVNFGGTASASTIIGAYSGYHSEGTSNVYIGQSAGMSYDQNSGVAQTGNSNVAVGNSAGYHLTTSSNNAILGNAAGYNLTIGSGNTFLGSSAGYSLTTGSTNVFLGHQAGYNVTTGAGNTIIGTNSYGNANLGSSNVIIGNLAGGNAYDGSDSVMIGRQANVSAGLNNARAVAIGYTANVSGSKGIAIGDSNAKGGAVAIGGASAGYNDVSIGPGAGGNRANLSPHSGHGTYIGYASGSNGTGNGIIIGGINAATSATIAGSIGIGSYTFAGATDSASVGIGAYAGRSSSGQRNMYLGMNAGWNTTGDYNVFLGYNNNITRTVSGSVHIGNLAGSQETTSNKLYIANSNTTTPLVYGEFDTPLLNVNGSLQVYGNPIYTGKYTSDTDTEVGNKNTASTGNTVHVEAYYTRAVDGDGYSESEYTGTGVRRIYYSNKFNADPTEIDSNENPEGWEVVDFVDLQVVGNNQGYGLHTFKSNTFDNTFAGSKTGVFDTIKTYEHLGQQCSIAVVVIPTKVNITTTGANEVFKFDLHTGDNDSTHNPYALCTVDWGDGSSTTAYAHQITGISNSVFISNPATTVDGTSLTGVTYNDSIWDHTYATAGNYVITINGTTNGLTFKESTQITEINIGNQVRFGPRTFDTCTSLQTIKGRVFYENAKCRDSSNPLDHMLEGCSALTANHHLDHWFSPTNKVTTNEILTAYWSSAGPPANLDTLRFGKNIKVTNPQFANWRPTNGNIPYINFDWTEVTAVFARSATVNRLPMAEGLEPKAEQVISLNESFSGNATDLGPELLRMSKNKPFLNNFRRAFMATGYSHYGTFRVSEASVWYGSAEIHGNGSFYTTPGTFVPWFIVEGGYGNTGSSFTASTSGRTFIAGDFDTDLSSMASIVGRYSNLSSALSSNYYFKGKGLENWDVSNVISFSSMFVRALRCNPDISRWDVSSAQNMNSMFSMASSFNSDIGDWDVRNVTDMTSMFSYAASFNQDISRWDTSSCLLASKMFTVADNGYWQGQTGAYNNNFNQDVGTKVAYRRGTSTTSEYTAWDVSSITTMEYMFSGYSSGYNSFNNGGSNSIQYWDTSSVTAMKFMFYNTRVFNQPLTSQTVTHTTLPDYTSWDVSNVTSFQGVFQNALAFNQDLSSWTPTLVTTYREMFRGAVSFDGDLSGWITASSPVTSFNSMFLGANAFTGTGLDGWVMPTGQDFTCSTMFANCTVFNKDISSWVMTRCTDMTSMFQSTIFNQDISGWDTSNVTSLKQMFYNNNSFNQDISSWSIASIPDGNLSTSDFMYSMFAAQSGGITGLSAANLSAIFVSWESQVAAGNGPINMRLGRIPSVTLTTAGQTAKDSLANSYGWQFT